jgi:hypothetical protein
MIYPTTPDILRCVDQTLLTASDESMPRMAVKSALASSRHMIRHANLRMQMERTILLDDIEKAGVLLDRLATYFQSLEAEQGVSSSAFVPRCVNHPTCCLRLRMSWTTSLPVQRRCAN